MKQGLPLESKKEPERASEWLEPGAKGRNDERLGQRGQVGPEQWFSTLAAAWRKYQHPVPTPGGFKKMPRWIECAAMCRIFYAKLKS